MEAASHRRSRRVAGLPAVGEEMSADGADSEQVWKDDGRVRVGLLRAKISYVKRVEAHFGREEALTLHVHAVVCGVQSKRYQV